ncbi:ABC transporter substrate-binding protein [Ideonella sp. DXS22W]|uniref:ABC transporter substrate-binding protein n=1 Tax=Pseudaquabacterium inlustre TaxID=2984192 RepID=A0ABU9CL38_9BURK
MQRRLVTTALASLLALAATASLAQAPDWKKIRIGVEGAYPPFSEVGPDGKLKGFDIDMANALCAELKAECTLVQQEWDGMIPALNARKFDAIIASMAATDERRKSVNFSDKYYNTPARLVAKAGAKLEASAAGLKGKKIGVQRSTIHDRFATDTFKESEIVRYAKADEVYLDLAAGRIDVAMGDSVAIDGGFLKKPQGQGYAFFGPPYNDVKYFGTGSSIAVRKADDALAQKFNAAIKAIRANGSYKKIQDKYFDFDVYGN